MKNKIPLLISILMLAVLLAGCKLHPAPASALSSNISPADLKEGPGAARSVETPPPPTPREQAALQAALDAAVKSRGEAGLAYIIFKVQVDHIDMSADRKQALIWLAFVDPDSGQVAPTEPGLAIANKTWRGWKVTLQVDDTWKKELGAVPPSLLGEQIRTNLLPDQPGEQVHALAAPLTGYKLPWRGGTFNYVTGSIGHVFDYKSCPTTCLYAFDFADGTMFPVVAAKAGRVKYFQDKYPNGNTSNTNFLVLEDASTTPTTYQVYYHLAQGSIPTALKKAGALVNQGQFIANADDTGASTGHHLHFMVHATPNSVWATSVDIRFSDVSINGGRPRTCSEAKRYPNYGKECAAGNRLLSGNGSGPLPGKPVLVGPSELTNAVQPAYQWKPAANAMQYLFILKDKDANKELINTVMNAAVCTKALCSYKPATTLPEGNYTFVVRAAGASGWGSTSTPMAFTVNTRFTEPEPIDPASDIIVPNPTYRWKEMTVASSYYLVVSDAAGANIVEQALQSGTVCQSGVCSYTPATTLKHGIYHWKVRAGDGRIWGPYSTTISFLANLAPPAPALSGPEPGEVVRVYKPLITWKVAPTAIRYAVRVYSFKTKTTVVSVEMDAGNVCSGEDCLFRSPVSLEAGEYQVRLRANNPYGWGNWTVWQPFRVQFVPDAPEPYAPSDIISTILPEISWQRQAGVTKYQLRVWDVDANVQVAAPVLEAGKVCCTCSDTCAYTAPFKLKPGGRYKFQVRSFNAFGWSAWSVWMSFSIAE